MRKFDTLSAEINPRTYPTHDTKDRFPRFSWLGVDTASWESLNTRSGRIWFGSPSTGGYLEAQNDAVACLSAVQRLSRAANPAWILQEWDSSRPIELRGLVIDGEVQWLNTTVDPQRWTENQILAQPLELREPLRQMLRKLTPDNTNEEAAVPETENKTTIVPAALAEQLREWASTLRDLGGHGSTLPGVIAGMEQVADDLAPKRVFDRLVLFTRSWADDCELVRARLDVGVGPKKAWTDQVHAEIEEALPGCKLVWKSYFINWGGGDEKLNVSARLRFEYDPEDVGSEDPECGGIDDDDVLQDLLYDQGGCAGSFILFEGN